MTLEQILNKEKERRTENGMFGINACKDSIRLRVNHSGENLYVLLKEFVKRANEDVFFNKAMVLACWELMNEK